MSGKELHSLLTKTLGLLQESVENGISRTYFYQVIEWHPQRSTRVCRVLFEPNGDIGRIQLCASSDNNNTVLVQPPFVGASLVKMVAAEIEIIQARQQSLGS
jgi:hypothetical protein